MRHLGPTFAPPPDSTAETLNGRASALPASVKRDRPEPNRAGGWLDSLGNDRSDPHHLITVRGGASGPVSYRPAPYLNCRSNVATGQAYQALSQQADDLGGRPSDIAPRVRTPRACRAAAIPLSVMTPLVAIDACVHAVRHRHKETEAAGECSLRLPLCLPVTRARAVRSVPRCIASRRDGVPIKTGPDLQ
jgi:hypothetical protein